MYPVLASIKLVLQTQINIRIKIQKEKNTPQKKLELIAQAAQV
jgi:hypothetical protein